MIRDMCDWTARNSRRRLHHSYISRDYRPRMAIERRLEARKPDRRCTCPHRVRGGWGWNSLTMRPPHRPEATPAAPAPDTAPTPSPQAPQARPGPLRAPAAAACARRYFSVPPRPNRSQWATPAATLSPRTPSRPWRPVLGAARGTGSFWRRRVGAHRLDGRDPGRSGRRRAL